MDFPHAHISHGGTIMRFSERILLVKPSPTLEVTALANAMKAKGIDIIGFGTGEPDFDTPDFIKEAAIKAIKDGKTKYTPVGGINELKKAIVNKFNTENNLKYEISNITVNCGGKHSFYNLMQVLLNKGDQVIIPSPYWVSYPPMVLLADGEPVIIDAKEENSFRITPQDLQKAITPRTRAVVINSPSNPTGATYSGKDLQGLVDVLIDKDILIITDDIYESLIYDDVQFCNIANLSEELKERTIVLNGVSKTYSMTGWRIGYMAGDEKIIKKAEILQSQSTSNPTSISQWAAVAALEGDQSVVKKMLEAFARRRKKIIDGLNNVPGMSCTMPGGAFYAYPNISGVYKLKGWKSVQDKYRSEFKSAALTSYLLEVAQVAVVPGIGFGTDDNIRLSFATSDENIEKGVIRIKEAVEKLA